MKYYVYIHIRPDKDEIFYVGIGSKRPSRRPYERAFSKNRRSKHWTNIINLNSDYKVKIIFESDDYIFIKNKEIRLIKLIGRKDLNLGTLVNHTDGGDGLYNPSSKIKAKMSRKGSKLSEEHKKKIGDRMRGKNSNFFGKFGKDHPRFGTTNILSEETKRKMSIARTGKKHTRISSNKGKARGKQDIITCPYCNKSGGNTMHRWHFNNCKLK